MPLASVSVWKAGALLQTLTVFLGALDYAALLTYLPPWIVRALPTWIVLTLHCAGWIRMANDRAAGASTGTYPSLTRDLIRQDVSRPRPTTTSDARSVRGRPTGSWATRAPPRPVHHLSEQGRLIVTRGHAARACARGAPIEPSTLEL